MSDVDGAATPADPWGASRWASTAVASAAVASGAAVAVWIPCPAVSSGLFAALVASVVCGSSTVNEVVSLVDRRPLP
jgi:hypothetical protein